MQLSPSIILSPFLNRVFVTCFTPRHNTQQGCLVPGATNPAKRRRCLSPPGEEFGYGALLVLRPRLGGSSCLLMGILQDLLLTLNALQVNFDPMLYLLYSVPHRFVLSSRTLVFGQLPRDPAILWMMGLCTPPRAQSPLPSPPLSPLPAELPQLLFRFPDSLFNSIQTGYTSFFSKR